MSSIDSIKGLFRRKKAKTYLLNSDWVKEQKRKEKRKILLFHFFLFTLIYLMMIYMVIRVFSDDPIDYLDFQALRNASIGFIVLLSAYFLFLMKIENFRIYYGYFFAGLIGAAISIGLANMRMEKIHQQLHEKDKIAAERYYENQE